MTTDLDLLMQLRPTDVEAAEEFLGAARDDLVSVVERAVPRATRATLRRRRARWVVVPIAAVLVGGSAVYAVSRGGDADQTRVTCRFDAQTTSVVAAVSGSPVADCAALWEETHSGAVPALRAYRVGDAVVVQRADADPPADADPVTAEPDRAVARAAELDARLHDFATGLWSQPCISYEEAVARVGADLTELGLDRTWTVRAEPPPTPDACGLGFLDPATATVVVRGVDRVRWTAERTTPLDQAFRGLGHAVADAVTVECLPSGEAARRARAVADDLGYPEAEVRTVVDRASRCSRVTVTAAGTVSIVVRGPARAD